MPERALPVYTMDEPAYAPADRVVAAVTTSPARLSDLEALQCRLLPTAPMPTPPTQPKPMATDPGGGSAARISNKLRPQDPGGGDVRRPG